MRVAWSSKQCEHNHKTQEAGTCSLVPVWEGCIACVGSEARARRDDKKTKRRDDDEEEGSDRSEVSMLFSMRTRVWCVVWFGVCCMAVVMWGA